VALHPAAADEEVVVRYRLDLQKIVKGRDAAQLALVLRETTAE
jgi:hypothetical protein